MKKESGWSTSEEQCSIGANCKCLITHKAKRILGQKFRCYRRFHDQSRSISWTESPIDWANVPPSRVNEQSRKFGKTSLLCIVWCHIICQKWVMPGGIQADDHGHSLPQAVACIKRTLFPATAVPVLRDGEQFLPMDGAGSCILCPARWITGGWFDICWCTPGQMSLGVWEGLCSLFDHVRSRKLTTFRFVSMVILRPSFLKRPIMSFLTRSASCPVVLSQSGVSVQPKIFGSCIATALRMLPAQRVQLGHWSRLMVDTKLSA